VRISIDWWQPIQLRSGRRENLIYAVPDLDDLPHGPGVYVFGRYHRSLDMVPVYIGKADNLRRRIRQQLNNAKLMIGLQKAPRTRRYLAIGEYVGRAGPKATRAIALAERSLIEYALAEGYELLNQQGTKRPHHWLSHSGSRASRDWLPKEMALPKKLGR
jgi:hypothetical protein